MSALRVVAVVLAGGTSSRFGADKLSAELAGRSLLDHAVDGVPDDWPVIIVGPIRDVSRRVRFVAESPIGSGPGAALVRGAQAAIQAGAEVLVSLPGDAPEAGAGAIRLVEAMLGHDVAACVGQDAEGRDQPLQLAVRGEALSALAAVADSANASARSLLGVLPGLRRVALEPAFLVDIDTPSQAAAWLVDHA